MVLRVHSYIYIFWICAHAYAPIDDMLKNAVHPDPNVDFTRTEYSVLGVFSYDSLLKCNIHMYI